MLFFFVKVFALLHKKKYNLSGILFRIGIDIFLTN